MRRFFLQDKHRRVHRDYFARVSDPEVPKHKAASIAKTWGKDYWDGDRRFGYGGYFFRDGYWNLLAEQLIGAYGLGSGSSVLEVGCGKGFLLATLKRMIPGLTVRGIDISEYALKEAHSDVKDFLLHGDATALPFPDASFDLIISINVFHNLEAPELERALTEFSRVGVNRYLVVESFESEEQKANLLMWQLTCQAFHTPRAWEWWFEKTNYKGDFELIFFD